MEWQSGISHLKVVGKNTWCTPKTRTLYPYNPKNDLEKKGKRCTKKNATVLSHEHCRKEFGRLRTMTKGHRFSLKTRILSDVPPERKPELRVQHRDVPRNKNRNEGTFACSPGTKTGTRAHSPRYPPLSRNTALSRSRLSSFKRKGGIALAWLSLFSCAPSQTSIAGILTFCGCGYRTSTSAYLS